nr:condensation domain-containing protein [Xanthomonas oryzae]
MALRIDLSGAPTLGQLLASVKTSALQAQAHQDIPFEQVVELVQPPRSLAHAPLFQVMFSWQNTPQGTLDLGELEVSELSVAQTSGSSIFRCRWKKARTESSATSPYATALFERCDARAMAGALAASAGTATGVLRVRKIERVRSSIVGWAKPIAISC